MITAFRIFFKVDSEVITILPLENCDEDFLYQLLAIMMECRESFLKDFEADILIDEEEGKMYGRISKEDCTCTHFIRKLTPESVFVMLHGLVDLMDGIRWTCVWPPEAQKN